MDMVGEIAAKTLQNCFKDFKCKTEHKSLNFSVKYFPGVGQGLSDGSSINSYLSNVIHV